MLSEYTCRRLFNADIQDGTKQKPSFATTGTTKAGTAIPLRVNRIRSERLNLLRVLIGTVDSLENRNQKGLRARARQDRLLFPG